MYQKLLLTKRSLDSVACVAIIKFPLNDLFMIEDLTLFYSRNMCSKNEMKNFNRTHSRSEVIQIVNERNEIKSLAAV